MIRVADFYQVYDSTVAVRGLSVHVQPGEVLGLIGPNGAGKTTTLRSMAGIIPASSGQIQINGYCLATEPTAAKYGLAYIPDDPQLFDDMTVMEHLGFYAAAYDVDEAEATADQLLHQFQLAGERNTPARQLSRGTRQKLSICCHFLYGPKAILFDEPLTGLDPHAIRTLKESIRQRTSRGAAVIVSSHLLSLVEDICSHVLILRHGRSRFCGTLTQLKDRFAETGSDASLEEIYFLSTSADEPPVTDDQEKHQLATSR